MTSTTRQQNNTERWRIFIPCREGAHDDCAGEADLLTEYDDGGEMPFGLTRRQRVTCSCECHGWQS